LVISISVKEFYMQHITTQPLEQNTHIIQKAIYTTPVLTTYGSVSKLTMGGNGTNTDGMGPNQAMSDSRIKENITRIGQHPLGMGLYLFDYKPEFQEQCGTGRQFGVMADEVEAVMPEAVSLHANGYKMVNYHLLGISRTLN
jgi:Chaperone of endosialidase